MEPDLQQIRADDIAACIAHEAANKIKAFFGTVLDEIFTCQNGFVIQLYGSLDHGLWGPAMSKICFDVAPVSHSTPNHLFPGVPGWQILSALANRLQRLEWSGTRPELLNTTLIYNGTVERPLILFFNWGIYRVHVTCGNTQGVSVSQSMRATLTADWPLRCILFHVKHHLRHATGLVGSQRGQIPTYAVYHVVVTTAQSARKIHPNARYKDLLYHIWRRLSHVLARQSNLLGDVVGDGLAAPVVWRASAGTAVAQFIQQCIIGVQKHPAPAGAAKDNVRDTRLQISANTRV